MGESVRSGDRSFEPLIGHGQSELLGDHILIGLCVLILIGLCVPGRNLTLRWLRFSIIAHNGSEQKGEDRTEGQQVCCADGQWTVCSLERHGSADERHAKYDANHKHRGGRLRRSCKKQRHLFECWRWYEHWRWRQRWSHVVSTAFDRLETDAPSPLIMQRLLGCPFCLAIICSLTTCTYQSSRRWQSDRSRLPSLLRAS